MIKLLTGDGTVNLSRGKAFSGDIPYGPVRHYDTRMIYLIPHALMVD